MYVQGTFLHSMRVDGLKALGLYISAQPYGQYTSPGGAVIEVDPQGCSYAVLHKNVTFTCILDVSGRTSEARSHFDIVL